MFEGEDKDPLRIFRKDGCPERDIVVNGWIKIACSSTCRQNVDLLAPDRLANAVAGEGITGRQEDCPIASERHHGKAKGFVLVVENVIGTTTHASLHNGAC